MCYTLTSGPIIKVLRYDVVMSRDSIPDDELMRMFVFLIRAIMAYSSFTETLYLDQREWLLKKCDFNRESSTFLSKGIDRE